MNPFLYDSLAKLESFTPKKKNPLPDHPSYIGGGGQTFSPMDAFNDTDKAWAHGVYNSSGAYGDLLDQYSPIAKLINLSTGNTMQGRANELTGADYINSEYQPESGWQKLVSMAGEAVADPLAAVTAPIAALKSLKFGLTGNRMAESALDKAMPFLRKDIIAGKNAKSADLNALSQAERLKADGVDADTIYRDTGWWLDHPDGRPRWEIDDSKAVISPDGLSWGEAKDLSENGSTGTPLGNILKHNQLNNNYSGLTDYGDNDIRAYVNLQKGREGGSYNGAFGDQINMGIEHQPIYDNGAVQENRYFTTTQKETLMHEVQHAIQQRENMARGGSPDQLLPTNKESLDSAQDYYNDLIDEYNKTKDPDLLEFIDSAKQDLDYQLSNQGLTSYDRYQRLAGEAEARLVQSRMNMTPAERKANPFYKGYDVPLEDQIVRYGDGEAMSAVDGYKGQHTAPEPQGLSSLDNMSDMFPDDIYTNGLQYYGTGQPALDQSSLSVINKMRGKPNKSVTIYRAVPAEPTLQSQIDRLVKAKNQYMKRGKVPAAFDNGMKGDDWYEDVWDKIGKLERKLETSGEIASSIDKINPNDWVTLSRQYAKQHGDSALNGKYKIISKKVKASELHTDGNSIHEWGYNPEKKDSANLLDSRLLPIPAGLLGIGAMQDKDTN